MGCTDLVLGIPVGALKRVNRQRWFLLWASFPFLKVHACPSERLSFFLCLWLPNYCVIETPTIFQAFTVSHLTDLLPDF